jgi:penicillin-binding protein 2
VPDHRFSYESLRDRYRALVVFAALFFGVIGIRLVHLQVLRGTSYRQQAEENRIRPEILHAHRGRLLDRKGRVIADNAPSYHLSLDPRDRAFRHNAAARDAVVSELARVLKRDETELRTEVERARQTSSAPITIARNVDFPTLSAIVERMEKLPGVEVRPEPARRYPYGTLASHLIGYLGEVSDEELSGKPDEKGNDYRSGDLVGRSGVEKSCEKYLRGVDGVEYVEVDALGRRTNLFEELPSIPSIPGDDVVLSIDLDLQLAAEAALDSVPSLQKREFSEETVAHPGCIVALDARSGEVLAMASRPDFDPNLFVAELSSADWKTLMGEGHPLLNRSTQAGYPPGSTFKILTALAGLREGCLTPTMPMPVPCRGGIFFGNRVFHCYLKRGHGSLVLRDAIEQSCDVYFYQVGMRLGVQRLTDFASACSLGVRTGVDLPQERSSLVPVLDWYRSVRGGPPGPGAALNLAIGQGELLLTPISLARFVAAVVNGGTILRPRVVRQVRDGNGGTILDAADKGEAIGRLPTTDADLMAVREGLEAVVMDPGGTGKKAQVKGFRVGGKTGTAQNPHGQDHALFVGYAPADDPQIVVVAVLEESGHGGAIAAPAAQRVLDAYLNPVPMATGIADGGMR